MKRFIAMLLCLTFLLCGCCTVAVKSEIVEAIVIDVGDRFHSITARYEDVAITIENETLYEDYKDNIGNTIRLVLITRERSGYLGSVRNLKFNLNVYNGGELE